MAKKQRKLSADEQKRMARFEATAQELAERGYPKKDLTVSALAANTLGIVVAIPVLKKLCDCPQLAEDAAGWFASKWGIPPEAYRESIQAYISKPDGIPQWYVLVDAQGVIVAGAGVIQNDFHNRKDLSPNLCALYVEPCCRGRGLAGQLLDFARREVGRLGMARLYLLTDHTAFYERYGWEYLCMTQEDGGGMARVYVAST